MLHDFHWPMPLPPNSMLVLEHFGTLDHAMTRRAGSADLPLHGGRVPKWLGERMTRLGAVISEAIVHHYGRDELLRRLAHPVLVPVLRRRHGHGLALVRHHHQRASAR